MTAADLRAALDAAGLPGAEVRMRPDGEAADAVLDSHHGWCVVLETREVGALRIPLDEKIQCSVRDVTARHDSAARVLGAPDLATSRALAAENAALWAEVGAAWEALGVVDPAFRTGLAARVASNAKAATSGELARLRDVAKAARTVREMWAGGVDDVDEEMAALDRALAALEVP